MKSVNLNNETIKILGTHFSYNKNLENEKNFRHNIESIENILKVWKTRNFHDWKVIPTYLIHKFLSKNFKFHNNTVSQ